MSTGAANPGDAGGNQNGGEQQQPWYADIRDPDARALMEAKGYATPADAAVAYCNLNRWSQAKLGKGDGPKDVLTIPGEGAGADEWGKVYAALGRPEAPDKYDLKLPEGVAVEQPFMDAAKTWFHDAGLSTRQSQLIVDKWESFVGERMGAQARELEIADQKAIDVLKGEYRTAGKDWDSHVAAGQAAVKQLGLSNATLDRLGAVMGLPAVVEIMAKIGANVGSLNIDTPEQAQAEINRRLADKSFQDSLRNKYDPAHAENLKRWESLHAAAATPRAQKAGTPPPAAARIDAPTVDGDRGAALAEIDNLTKDQAFQGSLRDPKHPLRAANLARWEKAFARAYKGA